MATAFSALRPPDSHLTPYGLLALLTNLILVKHVIVTPSSSLPLNHKELPCCTLDPLLQYLILGLMTPPTKWLFNLVPYKPLTHYGIIKQRFVP